LGPGMGTHNSTKNLVRKLVLESPVPLILDADALNNLSADPAILKTTRTPKILTPHPGEMARLRGRDFADDPETRLKICQDFARKYGCVVLLKGRHTVVASAEGRHYINRTGNVGMATAGAGDVLTGMITALTGQGLAPFDAAKFGAYLHGLAGDMAAKKRGKTALIATDIIEHISAAFLAAR
ncbi:MAG: NAD(P)H-hydrate dehydratase, partial [Candidatus Omnitrophica bacterium]|nr:NAD(P)H-hydrate dehydratase [Candidatus Omnitrophota bacterium]